MNLRIGTKNGIIMFLQPSLYVIVNTLNLKLPELMWHHFRGIAEDMI